MFFFKKPECAVCKSPEAKDCLTKEKVGGGHSDRNLCRIHFFEEFKKEVTNHPHKMIVTFPLLTIKHAVYGYYPLPEMKKYAYPKADQEAAQNLLQGVPLGKVGFFDNDASEKAMLKDSGQYCERLDIQDMQIISREEAWAQIQTGFTFSPKNFDEGFRAPYGEEGVFLTSLL